MFRLAAFVIGKGTITKMKKIIMTTMIVLVAGIAFGATEGKKEHTDHTKIGCTCSPACASGWNCCDTANGHCGCFINSCP